LTNQAKATFGLAVTAVVFIIIVAVFMCYVVSSLNSLYSKVTSSEKVDETPSTIPAVVSYTKPKASSGPVTVSAEDNAEGSSIESSKAESIGVQPIGGGSVSLSLAGAGLPPLHSKLAHLLGLVVSAVIALCVGIVLADGTSVVKLRHPSELPQITARAYWDQGLKYRIDELLGPTYGIGLHHDQSGFVWTEVHAGSTLQELIEDLGVPAVIAAVPSVIETDDLKHPVPFLRCDALTMAGLAACTFGFIAETVAVLMLIFHAVNLGGMASSRIAKPLAAVVWLVLGAGFLIVILLAIGIYTMRCECHNDFIPYIMIQEHFNYNYGFAFAITGFGASVLMFFVTLFITGMKDSIGESTLSSPLCSIGKVLGSCFVTAAFGMMCALAVMASNNDFAPPAEVDPNFNPCEGQQPFHAGPNDGYFSNVNCFRDAVTQTLEQAGGNVTRGYVGGMDAGPRRPITKPYSQVGLCPVNVHWHLGAEHLSVGQYDRYGTGPNSSSSGSSSGSYGRQLAAGERLGNRCHHYRPNVSKFTTPFNWKFCTGMQVGETYEVHWPHSAAGACGTQWQMQSPFYDGVFCRDGIITIAPLNTYQKIGVQSQTFVVVNDEAYYQPNLFQGMLTHGQHGLDMAMYTGSTTGTSRNNAVCSRYTPITWQVDRKCHLVSASSFDKMCQDMLNNRDDMSMDIYPHGSREVVAHALTANNQVDG